MASEPGFVIEPDKTLQEKLFAHAPSH
jgi:hypothetical protein